MKNLREVDSMGIHESNANSLPDSDFVKGDIKYLVKENKCRLLDGRRTPGYIEECVLRENGI